MNCTITALVCTLFATLNSLFGGIVASYEFTGGSLDDSSGNNRTAAIVGALNGPVADAEFGDVFDLTGGSGSESNPGAYFEIPSLNRDGGGSWSLAMWINDADAVRSYLFDNRDFTGSGGGAARLIFSTAHNTPGSTVGLFCNSAWNGNTASIADSEWHHVAWVYDDTSTQLTIYVDNVATVSTTSAADLLAATIRLGNRSGDGANGQDRRIDNVVVFDTAASPAEIDTLFNAPGTAPPEPALEITSATFENGTLDLTWNSGEFADIFEIISNADLAESQDDWFSEMRDIPNAGDFTSASLIGITGPRRFFVVRESTQSPPMIPEDFAIVPLPTSLVAEAGDPFRLDASTRILYNTRTAARAIETSLAPMAAVLASELELITGTLPAIAELATAGVPTANDIVLMLSTPSGTFTATEDEEDQTYTFASSASGLDITSAYTKGVSYGTASLIHSLREDVTGFYVDPMTITDTSDAAYRTVMIDLARQQHSIGVIEDVIRMARLFKIRYIQLHLTDDQLFTFPFAPVTDNISGNFTYTLAELNDLVDYADARGVTLVPEIDLPGHSSRLKQSNYLNPDASDNDIADPANYGKIQDLVDAVLTVFDTSPYFHIGGDESGAGESTLVAFLAEMNDHLRGTPPGGARRMLVWEGFRQSAVAELPTTGDDRVIVLAWEGAYRPPWTLLQDGYQVVNASWRPMYVVGGGTRFHPGSTSGKKWDPEVIQSWNKDTFMHWERNNVIFRDAGPSDPIGDDHAWDAANIGREDQVIGGQLLFWEQRENSVLRQMIPRIAVMAERLWSPNIGADYANHKARADLAMSRVLTIVQPVEILPGEPDVEGYISDISYPYEGADLDVTLVNRTRIPGTVRYETRNVTSPDLTSIEFFSPVPVTGSSATYSGPFTRSGGFSIRAKLFRNDGTPVAGDTWSNFLNYPNRVQVTEYDIGVDGSSAVPDMATWPATDLLRVFETPMLRGTWRGVNLVGQLQLADLEAPATGDFVIEMKSSSGHASLYLDLNRDGNWDANEKLITDTPSNETRIAAAPVTLQAGVKYRLRVDHKSDTPRPVLVVYLTGPDVTNNGEISPYLSLPE